MKYIHLLKSNIFYQSAVFFSLLVGYQFLITPTLDYIAYVFVMITIALIAEFLSGKILNQRVSYLGAYITSLIVILICFYSFGDGLFISHILIVVFGIVGKSLLKKHKLHLFNPMVLGSIAVLGLASIGIVEYPAFGWQGASSKYAGIDFCFFASLIFGGYVAYKTKKVKFILSFFIVFILGTTAVFQEFPTFFLTSGTLYFFLLLMALEPKTSNMLPKRQVYLGAVFAIILLVNITYNDIAPYIVSIFLFNVMLASMVLQKKYLK